MNVEFDIELVQPDAEGKQRVIKLFEKLDPFYTPELSSLVSITDYSAKLISRAEVFIASVRNVDVGILAIYTNATDTAFISSIGVDRAYQGYYIGSGLLAKAIETSANKGLRYIRLEVSRQNTQALEFYLKKKFIKEENQQKEDSFFMLFDINSRQDDSQ